MTTSQPDLKALFLGALERPQGPERAAYLADACRGEASLRAQVEELLEAHVRAGVFLASATETAAKGDPDLAGGEAAEWLGPETARENLTPPGTIAEGPGSRIGSYTIIRKLGEGGMGIVFLAEQERRLHRKVALKVIKPGMDTEQVVARFEAERQALALMEHPGIARVLDAGATESGRPFFGMELIDGVPINEYCDHERLSPRQRLELFVAVCRAIEHAHQRGIIHRDIKPSNVLVTLIDGQPVPKVIDFGVAKAIDRRLTERTLFTQHGALVGTPEYMSPEQAGDSGAGIDTRSDVYALGVLLYELLTGTTPLGRVRLLEAAFSEVLRRIREEEPPRPSTRLSGSGERLASIAACRDMDPARMTRLVRGELDWITMKALEKDRARRYATALELGRDVRRYLDGDPVEASPPSLLNRAGKLARKHRGALLIAAGAVSMLVGAALVSWWLMLRTRPDERPAVTSVPGQPAAAQDKSAVQQATRAKRERLLEIYGAEAAEYAIYRDASRKEKVELRPEPVYVWTNPVRGGGQDGAVYVWTCRGRAEALGSFFSYPASGQRHLSHEFHSLS
ncbi:MAG TPA: serine/threonine-protein kinase, partial [Acidimicrobiales bacterium]|nr:serine/threonine-protein kinase [Acidimicrobiales bacterium]